MVVGLLMLLLLMLLMMMMLLLVLLIPVSLFAGTTHWTSNRSHCFHTCLRPKQQPRRTMWR